MFLCIIIFLNLVHLFADNIQVSVYHFILYRLSYANPIVAVLNVTLVY